MSIFTKASIIEKERIVPEILTAEVTYQKVPYGKPFQRLIQPIYTKLKTDHIICVGQMARSKITWKDNEITVKSRVTFIPIFLVLILLFLLMQTIFAESITIDDEIVTSLADRLPTVIFLSFFLLVAMVAFTVVRNQYHYNIVNRIWEV